MRWFWLTNAANARRVEPTGVGVRGPAATRCFGVRNDPSFRGGEPLGAFVRRPKDHPRLGVGADAGGGPLVSASPQPDPRVQVRIEDVDDQIGGDHEEGE